MVELTRAEQFIYSKLQTIAGVVTYSGIAVSGAAFPYIVVKVQSPGADVMGVGTARILTNPLFLVEAVDQVRTWSTVATLADQIDSALQGTTGSTSDGRILSCVRETPYSLIEENNNTQYRHLGGLYRLQLQPLGA